MIAGIPYIENVNTLKKREILKEKTYTVKETSLYSLFKQIEPKRNLVVINSKYLTWLEDVNFDYLHHKAYIKYYTYKQQITDKRVKVDKLSKDDEHLEYKKNGVVYVRYAYEYKTLELKLGRELTIYNLDTNTLIKYKITRYVDEDFEFSLEHLYSLYKNYCYKDMYSEFGQHEGGYTFIYKELPQFKNKDVSLRKRYKLPTWSDNKTSSFHKNDEESYRDTRVYEYTTYVSKMGDSYKESSDLYKYRRLAFELYLYCSASANKTPIDAAEYAWETLGKTAHYIKMNDGTVPFFVKCEWFNNNTLKNNVTWRR